ncbi:hypothetical protein K2X33_00960 [bacterium]|nr:hypothetical protein [bacterium]
MKNQVVRSLLTSLCVLQLALAPLQSAFAAGPAVGERAAIHLQENPCAYYLRKTDEEAAVRITEGRTPEELMAALDGLKTNPQPLLDQLNVKDLTAVSIASIGAPLNKTAIAEEAHQVKQALAEQGLSHIPVSILPRPYTFLENLRWQFPIASDRVPEDRDSVKRGRQITAAANIPTWLVLSFISTEKEMAWLLAIPTTLANLYIDYLVGKNQPSLNNFFVRAGDNRASAIFRNAQVSFCFALPFYIIPRLGNLLLHLSNGGSVLDPAFQSLSLAEQAGAAAVGTLLATKVILTNSLLQGTQIFTFMNPNARIDKYLTRDGTPLSAEALSTRNTWRIAGFFALTAPIFALANNPEVTASVDIGGIPVAAPLLAIGSIAVTNYLVFYHHPNRMTFGIGAFYQGLGQNITKYVVDPLFKVWDERLKKYTVDPIVGLWRWLRGNR